MDLNAITLMNHSKASRRTALTAMFLAVALTLGGCASVATGTPPDQVAKKRQVLQELGFEESPDGWRMNLSGRVLFDTGEATLSADDASAIARVSRTLLGVGIDHIAVEGHTDNVGAEDHNARLSERRAEAVATALAERGFAPANIARRGYGSQRPIADNTSEAGRARNRRATLIVGSI